MLKRYIYFVFLVSSLILSGCENGASTAATKNAITGHSFRSYRDDANWEIVSFRADGSVTVISCAEKIENTVEHLTYTVHGVDIEVCCDYSEAWLPSHRGTLLYMLFFLPEYDCIKSDRGYIYYRWSGDKK